MTRLSDHVNPQTQAAIWAMALSGRSFDLPCETAPAHQHQLKRRHHVTRTGAYRVKVMSDGRIAYRDSSGYYVDLYVSTGTVHTFQDRATSLRFRRALKAVR